MKRIKKIAIRRKDHTVEPDKDGKYPIRWFLARINSEIPPTHRLCKPF